MRTFTPIVENVRTLACMWDKFLDFLERTAKRKLLTSFRPTFARSLHCCLMRASPPRSPQSWNLLGLFRSGKKAPTGNSNTMTVGAPQSRSI